MIPRPIRTAARWWDHAILYPRRRAKLMKAAGVQDACTKFDLKRKRRKASETERKSMEACVHAQLAKETGWVRHG